MNRELITSLGNPLLINNFKSHTPRESVEDMLLCVIRAGFSSISTRLVIETARGFLQPQLKNILNVLQLENDPSHKTIFQSIIRQTLPNHSAI
jgi:hypothetical protein